MKIHNQNRFLEQSVQEEIARHISKTLLMQRATAAQKLKLTQIRNNVLQHAASQAIDTNKTDALRTPVIFSSARRSTPYWPTATFAMILAGVLLAGWGDRFQLNVNEEIVDAMLLADDLPISAYLASPNTVKTPAAAPQS